MLFRQLPFGHAQIIITCQITQYYKLNRRLAILIILSRLVEV